MGPAFARFPLWRDAVDRRPWFDSLTAAGVESILVLDSNAFLANRWRQGSFVPGLRFWNVRFPDARFIQAGNEPDGTGDASSRQTRARYRRLIREVREVWPAATVIAGGLVGIRFEYFDGLAVAGAHVAAFHPYAQTGDSVQDLVAQIRQHTNLPLWATEFGTDVIPDPHERAVWFTEMLIGLWQAGTEVACVHRYDDDGSGFSVAGTESEAAILDAIPGVA